jgi:cobalt/nickel transport system permease protein
MHMSDALISLPVGATLWAATATFIAISARKLRSSENEISVARMGIMGAFVFASQMVNFAIPGTGSSGHLGGGLLLAITLGPWPGFLAMASVLLIQALFFADGGLLAWGANVFNLGFFTCFVAYPLIFKTIAGNFESRARVFWASVFAATVGLQLGSLAVVLQTTLSRISALPFETFVTLMQPIHLAIGVVEGLVTAGVVLFLHQTAPETFARNERVSAPRLAWGILAAAAVFTAGGLSLLASEKPDGLEWAIHGITGQEWAEASPSASATHEWFTALQKKMAFLPDYAFPTSGTELKNNTPLAAAITHVPETSLSGIVGGIFVAALSLAWALALRAARKWKRTPDRA